MKKTLFLLTIIAVFLSACSNQRAIENAMKTISEQSRYIDVPPEPKSLWPIAVILGIVLLLVIVEFSWYIVYNKKELKKSERRPQRHVTKVYYPQPQTDSHSFAPTQPRHGYEQPPWRT